MNDLTHTAGLPRIPEKCRVTLLALGDVGSTLLLAADTIAKTVAATELPVSIFTSLLGVPFLLYLIIKPGRETR